MHHPGLLHCQCPGQWSCPPRPREPQLGRPPRGASLHPASLRRHWHQRTPAGGMRGVGYSKWQLTFLKDWLCRGAFPTVTVLPHTLPSFRGASASGTVTGSPSPPAPGPELRRSTRQAASGSKPGVQPLPAPSPKAAPNPGPAASPTGSGNSAVPTGKPTSVRSSTTASAQDPSLAGSKYVLRKAYTGTLTSPG